MADSDVDVRESSFTTFTAAEMEGELRTKDIVTRIVIYVCARATCTYTILFIRYL